MATRHLLSAGAREELFGIPSDTASLERHYTLAADDHDLVATRRGQANRLGLAIQLALLRYPGQGWHDGACLPPALILWIGEQIGVPRPSLTDYGLRGATRTVHRSLAIHHLGLRAFARADFELAVIIATDAAFGTDNGATIMRTTIDGLRSARLVLPSIDTLERIGLTGRARARRISAQALNDALSDDQKTSLERLLNTDSAIGQSRLTWLRGIPHSTSAASLHALLERLDFLRQIELPARLGQDIHPVRLTKFAREGAVAPVSLLQDFGHRRRIATLSAQVAELSIVLTDTAIALFERLTGQLFTRSKRKHDQDWTASKSQIGRLIQLFGGTIDAMCHAREHGCDPFELLDEEIGWDRLLQSRDQIAALENLTTQDPLLLAARRYSQLRKFAPAFLEAFAFSVPQAGEDLQAALQLLQEQNQAGKRKLPDIVPMPFSAKHWESLVLDGGKPKRRVYETAVMATLRDRLRAGDVWVEGSRNYRRFDAYLVPRDEAEHILSGSGTQTDGQAWLAERRDFLQRRLAEVQAKLTKGQLAGVRLEKGRLKITPHDPITPAKGEQLDRAIDAIMPHIRITDLLWDVHARTGFLDAFTDLRSGRIHSNPPAVLAAILAGATNLGLERMAQASKGLSHAQLSWASAWHLRPETYQDALSRIIDAQQCPLSA